MSPNPLNVELVDGLQLVQQAASAPQLGYSAVELAVVERGRIMGKVPIGAATRIPTRAGVLVIYAEVTHYYRVPKDEDHAGDRYILHAWVTGQK